MTTSTNKQRAQGCNPERVSVQPSPKDSTATIVPRPASTPLTRVLELATGQRVVCVGTTTQTIALAIEDGVPVTLAFLTFAQARQLAANLVEMVNDGEVDARARERSQRLLAQLQV